MGRPNPRAPYVALDVMAKGAALPLKDAIKLERDAFLDVCTSAEGRAGMRFFFTQQSVQKLPKSFPGKARTLKRIGVDGADGYMGNAIAWLALEAGYDVIAHVPLPQFAKAVPEKLGAKYGRAVKKGAMSAADVETKVGARDRRHRHRRARQLRPRHRGAHGEPRDQGGVLPGARQRHQSGRPGRLELELDGPRPARRRLQGRRRRPPQPAQPALLQPGRASDDAARRGHRSEGHVAGRRRHRARVRAQHQQDAGRPAGRLARLPRQRRPRRLHARRRDDLPRGHAGRRRSTRPCARRSSRWARSSSATRPASTSPPACSTPSPPPRSCRSSRWSWKLREQKRFGIKNGAGIYEYKDGKPTGEWPGLAALVPDRGTRVASAEEIVERCAKALYAKARELCDRKIVASEEECDLAFVFGIGFAMYLGGPIFYGKQRGW